MTVVYFWSAEHPFDEAHSTNTHVPLLKKVGGDAVTSATIHHALSGLADDPAFATIVQVDFFVDGGVPAGDGNALLEGWLPRG